MKKLLVTLMSIAATAHADREITDTDRQFWSFKKPVRAPLPAVTQKARVRTPIDAFVLAKLEAQGQAFKPDTDRNTLIRRLSFDMLGLPPSPGEVQAFVRDRGPDAYERLVDRMLASPRYGERWGRHWLDVVGFSESSLFLQDKLRPQSWRFRDYVIKAMNADKPFDQFIEEQLAGDEMVNWRDAPRPFTQDIQEKLVATGFLRCAPDGTDNQPIEQRDKRFATQQATLELTAKALMGLTLNCVRCHAHKYDPIRHEDYYRMAALFQPALDPESWIAGNTYEGGEVRWILNMTPEEEAAYHRDVAEGYKNEKTRRKHVYPSAMIWALWDVSTTPSPTHLLERGSFETPGKVVIPGVLTVVDDPVRPFTVPARLEENPHTTGRRLAFARWLTRTDNPLTARVFVNRVWQYHFGTGIVATTDDFGARGARPTHPELLDWLALEFAEGGWSMKRLHRQILLSTTYRQRRAPRRLEAEAVRDAMLAVSGDLDQRLYGESVKVATVDGEVVVDPKDPARNRRSVYIVNWRTQIPNFLKAFDAPVVETNVPKRGQSVIPQQALALMNSAFMHERVASFASRTRTIDRAYLAAFARLPERAETAQIQAYLRKTGGDWAGVCHSLLSSNEFLYVD